MFTGIVYALTISMLGISFLKDRKKTKMALIKAWKSFGITWSNGLEVHADEVFDRSARNCIDCLFY